MPEFSVIDRAGHQHSVHFKPHGTLMEALRNAGFSELEALCGGSCSCATCHVYIDGVGANLLLPLSEDENDLLDSSDDRRETSRLSCQISLSLALDGLTVEIAGD